MSELNNDSHRVIFRAYLDRVRVADLRQITDALKEEVREQVYGSMSSQVAARRLTDEAIGNALSTMTQVDLRLIEKITEVEMEKKR